MDEDSIFQQIDFLADENACTEFRSNNFARSGSIVRKCMDCGYDIAQHQRAAVSSSSIKKVIESVEAVPSLIEPRLYLGGLVSAMNIKFMQEKSITLVVNTAAGLECHFPKFAKIGQLYEQNGVKRLHLNYHDVVDQEIEWSELLFVLEAIQETIKSGHGVLVHCAQGRSRSSTVILAYLMWKNGMHYDEALEFVQSRRSMSQPNQGFESRLRSLYEVGTIRSGT